MSELPADRDILRAIERVRVEFDSPGIAGVILTPDGGVAPYMAVDGLVTEKQDTALVHMAGAIIELCEKLGRHDVAESYRRDIGIARGTQPAKPS